MAKRGDSGTAEVAEQSGTRAGAAAVAKRSASRAAAFLIVAVMMVAALSLWTVIPLGWLWIGSRISDTQAPSGGPYMVVFVGILLSICVIAWFLSRLNRVYARLTGGVEVGRLRASWLKSMRDTPEARHTTVLETIVVGSVILAAVAGMFWFLFAARVHPPWN